MTCSFTLKLSTPVTADAGEIVNGVGDALFTFCWMLFAVVPTLGVSVVVVAVASVVLLAFAVGAGLAVASSVASESVLLVALACLAAVVRDVLAIVNVLTVVDCYILAH